MFKSLADIALNLEIVNVFFSLSHQSVFPPIPPSHFGDVKKFDSRSYSTKTPVERFWFVLGPSIRFESFAFSYDTMLLLHWLISDSQSRCSKMEKWSERRGTILPLLTPFSNVPNNYSPAVKMIDCWGNPYNIGCILGAAIYLMTSHW